MNKTLYAGLSTLVLLSTVTPALVSAQGLPIQLNAVAALARSNNQGHRKVDTRIALVGKVTAINNSTITFVTNNGTSYSIDTAGAKLIRRYGATMLLSDIQVNDELYVQANLVGATLKATTIQDLSLQARNANFEGTVQSITSNSFVLQSKNRGLQTIYTTNTTKILKKNMPANFADLTVGSTVKVDGVWDNANKNVTATKIVLVVKQENVHLNGTITNVSGTTLTFTSNGVSYTADTSKANVATKSSYSKDMSTLHVGDTVQVSGKTLTNSQQIQASLVIDFTS